MTRNPLRLKSGSYVQAEKEKIANVFMDVTCPYLSVADSYGAHSHHVVALKFFCKQGNTQINWNSLKQQDRL